MYYIMVIYTTMSIGNQTNDERAARIEYLRGRAEWINQEGQYTRFLGEKMLQGFVVEAEDGVFEIPLKGDRPLRRANSSDIVSVGVAEHAEEPFLQATVVDREGAGRSAVVDFDDMRYRPKR